MKKIKTVFDKSGRKWSNEVNELLRDGWFVYSMKPVFGGWAAILTKEFDIDEEVENEKESQT